MHDIHLDDHHAAKMISFAYIDDSYMLYILGCQVTWYNPSSQGISRRETQVTPSASRLKGSAAEDEAEAESSGDSDDESQQAIPGPSQVVTRRAGLPSSDSRYSQTCVMGTVSQIVKCDNTFSRHI